MIPSAGTADSLAPADGVSAPIGDLRPPIGTIASLLQARVASTPNAIALLAPGRDALTFAALSRQLAKVADTLAAAGFGGGSRIAIALPDGASTATAMLAVLCCAIGVPINPESDADTLRRLYRRLRVDAVIVDSASPGAARSVARELDLPLIMLHAPADAAAGEFTLQCEARPNCAPVARAWPRADDVALVLHTSGTTGDSKAVPLTQRSQHDSALHRIGLFGMTEHERGLCVTPLFTATSIRRSLMPPLAAGGSVVCVPRFDADAMLDWLAEFEPTFYAAGPAVHRAVMDAVDRRGAPPRHSLRYIVSGSTALPGELQQRLEDAFGVPLIQTYAMTEAGTIAQNPLPPGQRRHGSVGVVVQGEVAITDERGAHLPAGVSGEIIVRGPQVFQGYEGDPEANRNAFHGDWFRTGDVGYLDADGYLYVTGRLKEIVNRGGFKVPSAEVDAALLAHPDVADAATFGIAHPTLGEDVVSVVVQRANVTHTASELRDFLFDRLAAYKVPTRIVLVDAIPKTPLGKVRRRELGNALAALMRPSYESPRDLHERAVAAAFTDVLACEPAGSNDNFFALGGDSLRGAQVVARLNEAFGCNLDVSSLFRRPTVAEFAAEISAASGDRDRSAPPIVPLPRRQRRTNEGPPAA
jgi:acyl-CoA synthetase (AMP-forming)/AMP-acid ligase II